MAHVTGNTFSTYGDHCTFYKNMSHSRRFETRGFTARQEHIMNQFGQMDLFTPIKSKHDYLDEIVGAVAIPHFILFDSGLLFAIAVNEACIALYKAVAEQDSMRLADLDRASDALINSVLFLSLGLYITLKSMLSLVTRPFASVIDDFSLVTIPATQAYHAASEAAALVTRSVATVIDDPSIVTTPLLEAITSFYNAAVPVFEPITSFVAKAVNDVTSVSNDVVQTFSY